MWTFRKLIEKDFRLSAACKAPLCHHMVQLDLQALGERLGMDHSAMHDDLTPLLRCAKCGSKNVGLILHPPSGSDDALKGWGPIPP